MRERLRIALMEPFYGGSHRSFCDGWQRASRHEIVVEGLPARFWKWRMRAAAFELARRAREKDLRPDLWVVGSLLDAAHFRSLLGGRDVPLVCYFHESQAAYPWPGEHGPEERDFHYILTDLASAGAADAVAFNSHSLRDAFFRTTREFLERMPDTRPLWLLDEAQAKSAVLPLGIDALSLRVEVPPRDGPPAVLWCHRWEYDKNPEAFFQALFQLEDENVPFRLLVAGGTYSKTPEIFDIARARLERRIDHWGEVRDRADYARLLARADVVVSCAFHETFGLGMVEAAYAGAHPLAPRRLSYPEVFPPELHADCLYEEGELTPKLRALLTGQNPRLGRERLAECFGKYAWERRAVDFDNFATSVHAGKNL